MDNRSTAKAETALAALLRDGVLLDSVLLGSGGGGLDLHAVAKLTGGHALSPESASKLLDVFENDACESSLRNTARAIREKFQSSSTCG